MDRAAKVLLQDGGVDLPQHGFRFRVIQAEKHALGMKEIIDRRALAQKLRVSCNSKMGTGVWSGYKEQMFQLFTGFNGERAAFNDEFWGIGGVGDLACGRIKGLEIRIAVLQLRHTDTQEDCIGIAEGTGRLGSEGEPTV